jgi:sulfatase modifying factor 1
MKKVFALAAALALLCLGTLAQAVTVDMVPVGDAGNVGQLSGAGAASWGLGPDRICGSVSYDYRIGKYEVTASQYCGFLNAVAKTDTYGIYDISMDRSISGALGCNIVRTGSPGSYSYHVVPGWENRPANHVGWGDAARFANWLHNGQPSGMQDASTTEDGVYYLNGAVTSPQLWAVTRKSNWKWAIASEDEAYKAAYYRGGGTNAGYWTYPTQSDYINTGMANYWCSVWDTVNVGSYPYASSYGAFDMGGNVWEWNEGLIYSSPPYRSWGHGGYGDTPNRLSSACREGNYADYQHSAVGFRVVQAVPEPTSLLALGSGILALAGMIRRRNG